MSRTTTNQETEVLVINADYLQNQIGKFNGFCPVDVLAEKGRKFHQFWNEVFEKKCEFIFPHEAKRSRIWKRITPYFVILHNDQVLTYPAEIGKGQHNCGIHSVGIDAKIHTLGIIHPSEAYFTEAVDQLAVKLSMKLGMYELDSSFVGIINDDTYEFGVERVGFVHLIMINDDEKSALLRSEQFSGLEFIPINQLKNTIDDYEPWSRHVINLIYRPEQITPEMTVFLTEVIRLSSSIIYPSACRMNSTSIPVNHLLDQEIKATLEGLSALLDQGRKEGVI